MTDFTELAALGWSPYQMQQCDVNDFQTLTPARISAVKRSSVWGLTTDGPLEMTLDSGTTTGELAVGDWVLADVNRRRVARLLERATLLRRGKEHLTGDQQLIAANVDTLFITSSCNADFNPARLERYLALANDAGIDPVILLTKSDMCDDPDAYLSQARALGSDLPVLAFDALTDDVAQLLTPWCGAGQTVALAGSSGVGKTTIANALTGGEAATQSIREDDARGRHTTTERSLQPIPQGGWLIDTPGMRGLGLADMAAGIAATFPEISELADDCKFRDCSHEGEPGCAVLAAIERSEVNADRLERYKKLLREDAYATETIAQARDRSRKLGKVYRVATKRKR